MMNELLEKISSLIFKCGVKSLTMDDIAKSLAISKKTLYMHFDNKKDIVSKVANYETNKEFSDIELICNDQKNPIDQLIALSSYVASKRIKVNSTLIYAMSKYYPEIIDETNAIRNEFLNRVICNNIKSGINTGFYRENLNLDIFKIFYSYLLSTKSIEIYGDWLNNNDNNFNKIVTYHLRAIASTKGIEYIEKDLKLSEF